MYSRLKIKNFKSIKDLDIECTRVNLFIGTPNSGKSNILETLGLISFYGLEDPNAKLTDFIRFEEMQDLFYDGYIDEPITIECTENSGILIPFKILYKNDSFNVKLEVEDRVKLEVEDRSSAFLSFDYTGNLTKSRFKSDALCRYVKYYTFKKQASFPGSYQEALRPPFGDNLFSIAMGNKGISEMISGYFQDFNLKLMFKTREKTFVIIKEQENKLISYPYTSASDTLQRMIFFSTAMESSKGGAIVFEEPEAFAFPYYTKHLGEKIAFDEDNQYFISTHNPYLLLALMEKTPKDAISVFITYYRNYQTYVKKLSSSEAAELMDLEPFFNLDKFIEEEQA